MRQVYRRLATAKTLNRYTWQSIGTSASGPPRPEECRVPTYEYACKSCGEHLEVVQSFKDAALTVCPNCAGQLRKVFGNIGIAFKGSGFYRNDSRKKASSSSTSKSAESASADTKAEAKGDATKSGEAKATETKSSAAKSESSGSTKPAAATAS